MKSNMYKKLTKLLLNDGNYLCYVLIPAKKNYLELNYLIKLNKNATHYLQRGERNGFGHYQTTLFN